MPRRLSIDNHLQFLSISRVSIAIVFLLGSLTTSGKDQSAINEIDWRELAPLPSGSSQLPQQGVAACFAGVSQNALIVAGGCNFPDDPVYDGGQKRYYADIFVLETPEGEWLQGNGSAYRHHRGRRDPMGHRYLP